MCLAMCGAENTGARGRRTCPEDSLVHTSLGKAAAAVTVVASKSMASYKSLRSASVTARESIVEDDDEGDAVDDADSEAADVDADAELPRQTMPVTTLESHDSVDAG